MPPRIASISELLNSLDAATYFFVSSGIFIAVAAVLFFALGLWLGEILWRRYKRRFRESLEIIEAFKGEVALLKRRIAEQSTRPSPSMGPSPLQAIAFKSAPPKPAPHTVEQAAAPRVPSVPKDDVPVGTPLTRRAEPGAMPFSGKMGAVHTITAAARPMRPDRGLLFSPSEVFMVPRSRAFCLWTEEYWTAPAMKPAPLPEARGFALWTLPDFEPACRSARALSRAHTLWTEPGWTSSYKPGPPARSARAFTLWTEPGWEPLFLLPWSTAFSLWTDPAWSPAPVVGSPLPAGAGWSIWTSDDFVPGCRGAFPASRAISVWTEDEWTPAPIAPQPPVAARPFTLWTTPDWKPLFILPWSRAFSLWTDPAWSPAPVTGAPLPLSAAGSLWTSPDFVPGCRGAFPPCRAFSVWTDPRWTPARMRPQPRFAARPFTLWTTPDWKPLFILPWSKAFSLWTDAEWSPTPVRYTPLPSSAAGSLWTTPDFVPGCRGAFPPCRAYSVWTEERRPTAAAVIAEKAAEVARVGQGFIARALAATKQALGLDSARAGVSTPAPPAPADSAAGSAAQIGPPAVAVAKAKASPPVPKAAGPVAAPIVTVKGSLAETAPPPDALSATDAAPAVAGPAVTSFAGPLPPSMAFTVWASALSSETARKDDQGLTLTRLIESRSMGKTPLPSQKPTAEQRPVPPAPIVSASEAAAAARGHGTPPLPLLDLEPLSVPGERPG